MGSSTPDVFRDMPMNNMIRPKCDRSAAGGLDVKLAQELRRHANSCILYARAPSLDKRLLNGTQFDIPMEGSASVPSPVKRRLGRF
jgi:hypothetical protein